MKPLNHTVLLVEDDPDDVLLIMEALAGVPLLKIVHKKNGLEALNWLKEIKIKNGSLPCLIIMDINMPVLDGKQLLSILKSETFFQSMPIIVFTTSSNHADIAFCSRFNVPMITKPNDMKAFNERVKEFIEHCEAA